MFNFDVYRERMVAYYDDLCTTAYDFNAREFARQYDAAYAAPNSWLRDLALNLQIAAYQKRVLEIAAGHGRWTRYLSRTAHHVLVTDASARMLVQARELIEYDNDVPAGRCDYLKIDAFHIDLAPGTYDVGVAVNFFQHIPYARHSVFLNAFHGKLGSGATALIAINHLRRETRARLYRKPGEQDLFDARPRPDGSVCEIIDNVFTPSQLRAIFEPCASDFRYHSGAKFHWVTYQVR